MEITQRYPGTMGILNCVALKPEEHVVILIDELSQHEAIQILLEALNARCMSASIFSLPKDIQPDFPKEICQNMKESEVIILAASQSWYQVPARRKAKYEEGKRVVECYDLKLEMLESGALCGDYGIVEQFTRELSKNFQAGSTVQIQTKGGTNFTAKIKNVYKETGRYKEPGTGGNLPAGEISLGIDENSIQGEIIFDVSFDILGRLEDMSLLVTVKRGKVVDVQGHLKKAFETLLERDDRLRNVAEIGIGTNEFAVLGRSVLEDEKKYGTVHVGFGNDTYFGGKVEGAHLDGVILDAIISVDNKPSCMTINDSV